MKSSITSHANENIAALLAVADAAKAWWERTRPINVSLREEEITLALAVSKWVKLGG